VSAAATTHMRKGADLLQVQMHAATAFYQGLIDTPQRVSAMAMQLQVEQAIHQGRSPWVCGWGGGGVFGWPCGGS